MSEAKPTNSKQNFGDDEFLIKACADWHVARAKQQLIWAENGAATMFGSRGCQGVDTEPLERMRKLHDVLAQAQPRTLFLAQQLLSVVATILAHEDREAFMAQGPLLAIVRNVEKALDYCDPQTKIGTATLKRPPPSQM